MLQLILLHILDPEKAYQERTILLQADPDSSCEAFLPLSSNPFIFISHSTSPSFIPSHFFLSIPRPNFPIAKTPLLNNIFPHFPIAETPLFNNIFPHFPIAETPLFSNIFPHFPIVETPPFNNIFPHFPIAETPLFNNIFPHFPIAETPLFSNIFCHFPIAETPLLRNIFPIFPVAETPFLQQYFPLLKHHSSSNIFSILFLLLKHHFFNISCPKNIFFSSFTLTSPIFHTTFCPFTTFSHD
jgi:hypothetical protein